MTIIYITKYALTTGIIRVDAEKSSEGMFRYKPKGAYFSQCVFMNDFKLTEADAIERAEDLRNKKIKSLEKQIAKLHHMWIEVKDL